MTMLKQTKNHNFYEVWSEDSCESVYIDHKPTEKDIDQIWHEKWPNTSHKPESFKVATFYTSPKCVKCSGYGYYSYSTNPRVKCTDCKGKGYL